ncbi:hypothetical protein DAERI_090157 [Deinococcus aerius]|uniref:Lipoprotein n=1 Tax=Deinococcus aerius TaxID=200253 RepID=A0A2I9DND0_9DEIO|nr:hypothetical protein [Deinococcus aerius]GBF06571.1 hypothetical protein DAERI_090157 [Deinococcus aerius]
MKKLLGAVGLSAVLASCGDITVVIPDPIPGTLPSPTLTLEAVAGYSTNYRLTRDVRDQNGQTIAAGTFVVCNNLNTQMAVDVTWTGGLSKLYAQFKGLRTGDYENVTFYPFGSVDYSGSGTATYTFGPNTAPQSVGKSVSAQAIVVNPVTNVNVKGYTYVRLQGLDENGRASNIVESVTAIPVVDCL